MARLGRAGRRDHDARALGTTGISCHRGAPHDKPIEDHADITARRLYQTSCHRRDLQAAHLPQALVMDRTMRLELRAWRARALVRSPPVFWPYRSAPIRSQDPLHRRTAHRGRRRPAPRRWSCFRSPSHRSPRCRRRRERRAPARSAPISKARSSISGESAARSHMSRLPGATTRRTTATEPHVCTSGQSNYAEVHDL